MNRKKRRYEKLVDKGMAMEMRERMKEDTGERIPLAELLVFAY